MTITAKFSGKCRKCGGTIPAGETVDWVKGIGVYHLNGNCPEVVAAKQEWLPAGSSSVPVGTFTAVFGSESDYETVKLTKPGTGSRYFGATIFKLHVGNGKYEGVGFVNGEDVVLWQRVQRDPPAGLARALAAFELIKKDPASAGEKYALRANRCWRCDTQLTVPASIHRGLGPDCAKKVA